MIETSPVNTADASIHTPIAVTFNKSMDTSTITKDSFKVIHRGTGKPVDGTFEFTNKDTRAVFIPKQALQYGHEYEVVLTNEIKDKKDSKENQRKLIIDGFIFTAKASKEVESLQINKINMIQDEETKTLSLAITFNENLDPNTITENIEVKDAEGKLVKGTLRIKDNKTIIFTPNKAFEKNKANVYTVTLKSGMKSIFATYLSKTQAYPFVENIVQTGFYFKDTTKDLSYSYKSIYQIIKDGEIKVSEGQTLESIIFIDQKDNRVTLQEILERK